MVEIREFLKLEITRDCNLSCAHCYKGDKEKKYMSLETINRVFKNVSYINCLMIAGGESFLAIEQLEDIYNQIIKNNVDVEVMLIKTNCTILNDKVVEILAKLSKVVGHLYVTTMADSFRRMEIINKGIKKQADEVATFLAENDYLRVVKGDRPIQKIYNTGRAAILTEEDIRKANENKSGSAEYCLTDDSEFYNSRGRYNSPSAIENFIYRTVYVTVDGNLCNITPYYHTYSQIDDMVECNISEYDDLLDAVNGLNCKIIKQMLEKEAQERISGKLKLEYNKIKALKR